MRIIIASTTVPHGTSGGRLIVQWTADALREAGHQVEEFYLPFPTAASATLPALVGLRRMPFRSSCDRLITIRWPAHVLVHDNKAAWFIHHYREAFDLWDTPFRAVPDDAEGRSFRELLRHVDTSTLGECRDLFANSLIVRDRLRAYNGLEVEPLFPPIGGDTSRFRCEGYGDFIFYPSRITPIKRQELAVQAMAHTQTPVQLVIAGDPWGPESGPRLQRLAEESGAAKRIDLRFGWLSEDAKTDLLARCLAVAYLPLGEDSYGYVSLEASHARKAIITVTDAGGALEFVRDGTEGLVTEPTPAELGAAFDRLYEDRALAERLGTAADARRTELGIGWERVVERLVGDAE
jgi:glycosyltransferase involved in cell wall biosynthesis